MTIVTFEDGQVWEAFQPFGLPERSWECIHTPHEKPSARSIAIDAMYEQMDS